MRKICYILMAVLTGAGLVSCINDDTDMDDILAQYQVEPIEMELDYTEFTEQPDVPITDENDSA